MNHSRKRSIRKTLTVALLGSVILAVGTATSAFTFSWFSNTNNVTKEIKGHTAGAYFARGSGTSTDPYVINSPTHLYNLAWLYYIGYFDGQEPYFIIEKDLDMSGWTLPPIGTKDHPFNGHLDGYDTTYSKTSQTQPITIKNLTVSNDFSAYGNRHPANVTSSTFTSPEITGLFGYVAKDDSSKGTPSVKNLYIDSETVSSTTDSALTGIVAGYVDGELEGIHLDNSKVSVKDGTSNVSGFDNISEYTSVGYTTNKSSYVKNVTTLYEPYFVGKSSFVDQSGSGDEGNDWGSSIDMMTLNRRMNYISAMSTFSVNTGSRYNVENNTYGYSGITSSAKEMYWKNTSTTYWYVKDGTFLPLNIDTDTAFEGDETTVTPSGISTSYHTTSYYQNHTTEFDLITDNNSGYLVGRTNGNYADVRTRLQSLSSGLANSAVNSTYDGNIKVYTVDTTSGTSTAELYQKSGGSVTTDNTSAYGYTRFSSVMENFDKFMNGYTVVHGFHMVDVDVTNSSNWSSSSFDVKILGQTYSNYQFVKGCLNFTVAKKGYITTLLGSFYGQSGNNTMFDLFSINRDSNHQIQSVTRIKKIYKDSNGNISYDPSDTTGLTLVFDFDNVTGSNVFGTDNVNKAYYFELPVNAGDYAIGKSADGYMSYLMYLDIGANAGSGSESTSNHVYRTKVLELLKQINSTFTYPSGVYVTDLTTTDIINDKKTYCVQLGKTYSGTATMDVSSDTATTSLTTTSTDTGVAYFDDSLAVSENGTTITIDNAISESKVETQTIRLTYYDHYYGDETDELYVYMMKTSSSSEIPTTFAGYTGSKTNDGTYTLSTGGKEKFYDDNGAEAEVSSISSSEYDISSVNTSTPVISLRNVDTFTYLPTGSIGTDQYYGSASNETNPAPSGYSITATAISGKKVEEISRNSNYTIDLA